MKDIIRVTAGFAIDDQYENKYQGHRVQMGDIPLLALTSSHAHSLNAGTSPGHGHNLVAVAVSPDMYMGTPESPEQFAVRKKDAFEEFMAVSKLLMARDPQWQVSPVVDNPLVEFYVVNPNHRIGAEYRFPADEVHVVVFNDYMVKHLSITVSLTHWAKFCRGEITQL